MQKEQFTNKIYSSSSIQFKFENNFKQVICISPIKKGEILLAEHIIYSGLPILEKWLNMDKHSFKELYPRNENATSLEKISNNYFQGEKEDNIENYSVGIYDSWFNTSYNYNAGSALEVIPHKQKYTYDNICISFIISLKDIEPGEEVFLYYKREDCNVLHNEEILSNYQKEVNTICNFQSENINNKKERLTIMSNYLLNEISFTVYLNQILLKYGIKYNEIKNEYYKDDSTSEYKLDYLFYSKTSSSLKYESVNEAINNLIKYQFNTAFKHTSSVMKRYIK